MDELTGNTKKTSYFSSEIPNKSNIDSNVDSMVKSVSEKSWKELEADEKTEIDSYFMLQFENYMKSQDEADKRVCEEILKLYRAGDMKTIDEKTLNENT
jgi:hypothetical protein